MQKILVPVDGSVHALKALHIACDLALKYDGSIVLLHVLDKSMSAAKLLKLASANMFGAELTQTLNQAVEQEVAGVPQNILEVVGEKILEQALTKARHVGLDVDVLGMETGTPSDAILIAQMRSQANTIVMGCRGLTDLKTPSFGSVSQAVFARASCTCLSVK